MKIPTIAAILGLAALASAEVYLYETFSDGQGWKDRWTASSYREDLGKMEVSAGQWFADQDKSAGLRTTEDYRFYAMSTPIKPFSNKDKDLVIQFDVKNDQKIDCGGSYIKVLLTRQSTSLLLCLTHLLFSSFPVTLTPRPSTAKLHTTSCLVPTFAVARLWFTPFSAITAPTTT